MYTSVPAGEIAGAGSFCLFCENGDTGLPTVTSMPVAVAGLAGPPPPHQRKHPKRGPSRLPPGGIVTTTWHPPKNRHGCRGTSAGSIRITEVRQTQKGPCQSGAAPVDE